MTEQPTPPESSGALCGAYLNHVSVEGHCPACGGSSLFLGDGGYVTCARLDCPAPDAASTLLETDPLRTPLPGPATAGQVVTASDVLVQHDVTRKAMCDAFGAGYHLNWQQLVDRAQRSHAANGEWRREDVAHRRALANALGLIDPRPWADMIDQVSVIRAAASERANLLEEARDALEAAGQNGTHGDDWPAIAPAIRTLATRATNAEEQARAARQGEAEAIRARTAADGSAAHVRELFEAASRQRDAADEDARRAMQQRQEMAEERYALQQRAEKAEDELRRLRRGGLYRQIRHTADYPLPTDAPDTDRAIQSYARDLERWIPEDALGDDQPTPDTPAAPEPCDAYQPPATAADSGLCAHCGMSDYKHAQREQPAAPERDPRLHGPVPPQLVISIDLPPDDIAAMIRRLVQRPPGSRS